MTNNLVLPFLALLLTIVAALLPAMREEADPGSDPPPGPQQVRRGAILAAVVALAFTLVTLAWPETYAYGGSLALALAFGALASVAGTALSARGAGGAFGLGVCAAASVHFVSAQAIGVVQIAVLVGAFVGAFATSGRWSGGGYLSAVAALFVVSTDFVGRLAVGSPAAQFAGVILGIAFLIGWIVYGALCRSTKSSLMRVAIPVLVLAAVGYLACSQYLADTSLANLWLIGVVVAIVVHLILVGDTQGDSFRFILSTVIWLGAATVAFGMQLGYGMATTLLAGAATLALVGNSKALTTLAVPASILLYRLFRELHPDEARALDIGQHYTMIGIAIGALLPLLPIEWSRGRVLGGMRSWLSSALWLVLLLGIPIGAIVLLGSKGAIGMVVGLSFAAVVEGLRGSVSLAPMGIASGIGALTVLSFSWLGDWSDLERAAKIKAVLIVSAAALVVAGALFAVGRNQAGEPEEV